jgi:hypothetical protein
MDQEKRPAKYLVRTVHMNSGPRTNLTLYAYSAEDAKFQVELAMGMPRFETVVYVGPVNPDCKCLNECRCGVSAG